VTLIAAENLKFHKKEWLLETLLAYAEYSLKYEFTRKFQSLHKHCRVS